MPTTNRVEILKMRFDVLVLALVGSKYEAAAVSISEKARNSACVRCAKAKAEPQLRKWLMEVES
jgi:hypothetical protein